MRQAWVFAAAWGRRMRQARGASMHARVFAAARGRRMRQAWGASMHARVFAAARGRGMRQARGAACARNLLGVYGASPKHAAPHGMIMRRGTACTECGSARAPQCTLGRLRQRGGAACGRPGAPQCTLGCLRQARGASMHPRVLAAARGRRRSRDGGRSVSAVVETRPEPHFLSCEFENFATHSSNFSGSLFFQASGIVSGLWKSRRPRPLLKPEKVIRPVSLGSA